MPNNCCKELRLSSDVFSEFSSENSTMIINSAFSMAWLKNFQKSTSPSIFSQDNGSGSKSDALHFCALPKECHHLLGHSSEEAKAHIRDIMAYRPFRRTTRECGRGDTEKSSKGIHIALNWGFLMLDKPLSLVKLQFLQL
ncbi:hypothetical protein RHSIM_Rhsim12G0011500 [Rhododendron simsii]|uniref:Uncharacterized protein n=1 Tax=Rhododendron simsii TaxID=118357 RepID=A0A834G835_RHOSS|nr:hypothetical protein RHSIM_Rhsim12G0011500 [Rhododendron simsii]